MTGPAFCELQSSINVCLGKILYSPQLGWNMQASGTSDTLRELGAEFGVDVAVMDLLGDTSNEEGTVSSSEVRAYFVATLQ